MLISNPPRSEESDTTDTACIMPKKRIVGQVGEIPPGKATTSEIS